MNFNSKFYHGFKHLNCDFCKFYDTLHNSYLSNMFKSVINALFCYRKQSK